MNYVLILILLSLPTQAFDEAFYIRSSFLNTDSFKETFFKRMPHKKGFYLYGNNNVGYFKTEASKGRLPVLGYQDLYELFYLDENGRCIALNSFQFTKSSLVKWLEEKVQIKKKGSSPIPFFHFDTRIGSKGKRIKSLSLVINRKGEIIKVWDEKHYSLIDKNSVIEWVQDDAFIITKGRRIKLKKNPRAWFTHEYLIHNDKFYTIENVKSFVRPGWNFTLPADSLESYLQKILFFLGPPIPLRLNSIVGYDLKTGEEIYRWDSYNYFSIYDFYEYGMRKFISPWLKEKKKGFPEKGFDFLHINSLNISSRGFLVSINEIDKLIILDSKKPVVLKEYDLGAMGIHNQHHIQETKSNTITLFNNNYHHFPSYPAAPHNKSLPTVLEFKGDQLVKVKEYDFNHYAKPQGSFYSFQNYYVAHFSSNEEIKVDYEYIFDKDKKIISQFEIKHPLNNYSSAYRFTPLEAPPVFTTDVQKIELPQKCLSRRN